MGAQRFSAWPGERSLITVFNDAETAVTLDQLSPGQTATIAAIDGAGSFRRRLLELGLVQGTPITREGAAPLGDPLTYRVRGAVLALRRADASCVRLSA